MASVEPAAAAAPSARMDPGLTEAMLRQIRQMEASLGSVLAQREELAAALAAARAREEAALLQNREKEAELQVRRDAFSSLHLTEQITNS